MTSTNRAPKGASPANTEVKAAPAGDPPVKRPRGRPRKAAPEGTNTGQVSEKGGLTSGNAGAKTDNKPARRPAVRRRVGARDLRSAGARLREEMAKEGDSVGLVMLIRQAARIADRLEAIDRLLSGDADAWAVVSLPRTDAKRGRLVVEVQVGDVLKEERAQSTLFRHLVADIHRQRAGLRRDDDDDDDDDDLVD